MLSDTWLVDNSVLGVIDGVIVPDDDSKWQHVIVDCHVKEPHGFVARQHQERLVFLLSHDEVKDFNSHSDPRSIWSFHLLECAVLVLQFNDVLKCDFDLFEHALVHITDFDQVRFSALSYVRIAVLLFGLG